MTDRAALLARLARLVAARGEEIDLAGRLCAAGRSILGADGVAITVAYTMSNRVMLCATDDVIARLEDLQDVTGEGPCLDAYRHGAPRTLIVNEQPDPRWPELSRAAWPTAGPVTLHSIPMRPSGVTFGVFSLYLANARRLAQSIEVAQLLADAVGATLLRDPTIDPASGRGPWGSWNEVHKACGMVAAQLRVPPADALAILRAHAYATSTTLAATARRVLNRELDFRDHT